MCSKKEGATTTQICVRWACQPTATQTHTKAPQIINQLTRQKSKDQSLIVQNWTHKPVQQLTLGHKNNIRVVDLAKISLNATNRNHLCQLHCGWIFTCTHWWVWWGWAGSCDWLFTHGVYPQIYSSGKSFLGELDWLITTILILFFFYLFKYFKSLF